MTREELAWAEEALRARGLWCRTLAPVFEQARRAIELEERIAGVLVPLPEEEPLEEEAEPLL